jgi:hypothetical protein
MIDNKKSRHRPSFFFFGSENYKKGHSSRHSRDFIHDLNSPTRSVSEDSFGEPYFPSESLSRDQHHIDNKKFIYHGCRGNNISGGTKLPEDGIFFSFSANKGNLYISTL